MTDPTHEALNIMLRDLRETGANRGEPCGVHERPQWTCGYCLHNLLAAFEMQQVGAERLVAAFRERQSRARRFSEDGAGVWAPEEQ